MRLRNYFREKRQRKEDEKMQKIIDATEKVMNKAVEIQLSANSAGLNDNYMFDFKVGYNGGIMMPQFDSDNKEIKPQKIAIKPIEVLKELERTPKAFSLEMIDEKISILKDKSELINQKYTKREVESLIIRLENRKKYKKEHSDFYKKFENTDDAKIEKLLERYDLVMKTSDIFIPEFPDEAIEIMKEYTERTVAL